MNYNYDNLSRDEALSILHLPDHKLTDLLERVYAIRKKHKGNVVTVQLLTNARSGNCSQNCAYCAQSCRSTAKISEYDMISQDELLRNGNTVREKNLSRHCIGLSGIRFRDHEIDVFADRIKMLKQIGFEICCGGIIGLGENQPDVVDMLFEIRSLKPRAVPINFLIPMEGTPLEHAKTAHLTPEYCLKILYLARLLTPESDIRCAAGGQSIEDTIKVIIDAGFEYRLEAQ